MACAAAETIFKKQFIADAWQRLPCDIRAQIMALASHKLTN